MRRGSRGAYRAARASDRRSGAAWTSRCGRAQPARSARRHRRRRCARGGRSRPDAGGRSWGPGGIQRAQSGTVVAARCHQSSNAAAQPRRFPRRLADREHVDELRREQAGRQHRARTRSSLGRATPPHAQYRARRQGAGSCRRPVASRARASAAAPPAAPAPAAAAAAAAVRGMRWRSRIFSSGGITDCRGNQFE